MTQFLNKALDHTQLGLYLICFVNSPVFSGVINGFSGVITVSNACFGGVFTGIQRMFFVWYLQVSSACFSGVFTGIQCMF